MHTLGDWQSVLFKVEMKINIRALGGRFWVWRRQGGRELGWKKSVL